MNFIYSILKRDREISFSEELIYKAIQKAFLAEYGDEDTFSEKELENYRNYIKILVELDWPAYINGDTEFHQVIISRYESDGADGVADAIYTYHDALFLKGLEDQISDSVVIKDERIPLFHEAFLLYQLGYYFGAVSILINQLIGITADIERYFENNDLSYDPKTIELIRKRYGYNREGDSSRVVAAVLEGKEIDEDLSEYSYFIGYLRSKIFNTNIEKSDLEKHVNRHMVCHGVQLNYGTKEHALKVILCIDSLIWVSEVIASKDH